MTNYYQELEISQDASEDEIKKAYRRLALKWHPDKNPESEKELATAKFKEIAKAYFILSDPEKRKRYNNSLLKGEVFDSESSFSEFDVRLDEFLEKVRKFGEEVKKQGEALEKHGEAIDEWLASAKELSAEMKEIFIFIREGLEEGMRMEAETRKLEEEMREREKEMNEQIAERRRQETEEKEEREKQRIKQEKERGIKIVQNKSIVEISPAWWRLDKDCLEEQRERLNILNISNLCLLGSLDLSEFPNLVELDCSLNELSELNLLNNHQLTYLDCSHNGNRFTNLTLPKPNLIKDLFCSDNPNLDPKFLSNLNPRQLTRLRLDDNLEKELVKHKLNPWAEVISEKKHYLNYLNFNQISTIVLLERWQNRKENFFFS